MYSLPDIAVSLPPALPEKDLGDNWKKTTTTNSYRSGAVTETKYFNTIDSSKIESIRFSTSRAFNYGTSLTLTPKEPFKPELIETMTENGFEENAKYGTSSLKIKDGFTDNRDSVLHFMRAIQGFESLPTGVLEDLSTKLGVEVPALQPTEIPSLVSLCEDVIISDQRLFAEAQLGDRLAPSQKESLSIKLSEKYAALLK